jgi:nucleoside-diphosphate-sugar epimerase
MGTHVVVGAGGVGSTTALELAARGHEVKLVTRSRSGPVHASIERVSADASDPAALTRIATGADAIYNCVNPPGYHQWEEIWPPLAASFMKSAQATAAVLVTMSNLYGYGPLDHPMTEHDPLASTGKKGQIRTRMWNDALAAHEAGLLRATEARASDFYGDASTNTHFGRNAAKLLAGKRAQVVGDPDLPHSWTYIGDVGSALATLGTDERAWGGAWHVPTAPPLSQRELAERFCELAGVTPPKMSGLPDYVLRFAGWFSPQTRELQETLYQFDRPFVLDSSAFTRTFGTAPTPVEEALRNAIRLLRHTTAVAA